MNNRNCCRPFKCCTCPNNNNNYVNKTGGSSNQKKAEYDSNLQMTNHYRRINSVKCIVDTAPPKCYVSKPKQAEYNSRYSTPSLLRFAARTNSTCEVRNKSNKRKVQEERSSSVPPQRPATRRNSNLVPQNYLQQANTQVKINNLERKIPLKTTGPPQSKAEISNQKLEYVKKIIKDDTPAASNPTFSPKHFKKPTTNTNTANEYKHSHHKKTPIPTPRVYVNPRKQITHTSNSAGVSDYEYLQFSLRITEDIIRNDLYSAREMRRVFNSHLEANRGRLNTQKMLLQIDHLCKELDIQNKASRGGKKCCKTRCSDCSANYCHPDVQTAVTNIKLSDPPPPKSTNKELINKIFNGHVMTDEEIFNLSENDLQNVITEILNDHEPATDGEILSINGEDDYLIHNNSEQFRTPSQENWKLLSEQNSQESVNVTYPKKVETPVALTGTVSDYLQQVVMQMSDNISRHYSDQLANENEEQSGSDSKEKQKKFPGGDGQREQQNTLGFKKSTDSGITAVTEEYDIIDLIDTPSDESQSSFLHIQPNTISTEIVQPTEYETRNLPNILKALEKKILGIHDISAANKSVESPNSAENQKGTEINGVEQISVGNRSTLKPNSVISNETVNSAENQQETQINELHATENETNSATFNKTDNKKRISETINETLPPTENTRISETLNDTFAPTENQKRNSATLTDTFTARENQKRNSDTLNETLTPTENIKRTSETINDTFTARENQKRNSETLNDTFTARENQKRNSETLNDTFTARENQKRNSETLNDTFTTRENQKRNSETLNDTFTARENQKRNSETLNETLSPTENIKRTSETINDTFTATENQKRNSETFTPTEIQEGTSALNQQTLENEIPVRQQINRSILKRNSYTLPSTSISQRNSEEQNNSSSRDLNYQASSDEQREVLKRNSYTLPSTSMAVTLQNTDKQNNESTSDERNSDNKSSDSYFNSITVDQYIALKRNLLSQSTSNDNKNVYSSRPNSSPLPAPEQNEAVIPKYNSLPTSMPEYNKSNQQAPFVAKPANQTTTSTQVPSIINPIVENAENTMPEIYSDKTVTKIFPLSAINDSWLDEQEKSINETEIELEDHISYFNESKEHMSEIIQILLEQLSAYEEDDNEKLSKSQEKLSEISTEYLDDIKSPTAYSCDNVSIFSAADSLSDEGKSVYDVESIKRNLAKTVSKSTANNIKPENKTEKDEIISSITKYILEKTFATGAQNPPQIQEPEEENKIDFISTVEKLVNDRTNDLYQYCVPEKSLTEFPSRSLEDLNKYETTYCKNKKPDIGYKSSKRKSSKSDISEGEVSKPTSNSSFSRKISVDILRKSEQDILQHLKKYEAKPKAENSNPLQPCLCDYELKNLENKNYDNYVPKFSKSLFYPTVSTQTSNTDFNAGFNDTLLSDGEVHFTDKSESDSESFSR